MLMKTRMLRFGLQKSRALCASIFTLCAATASAQLYWDGNGATLGAGTAPSGIWGTDAFWNTDSSGETVTPGAWIPGSAAVFSAGTDATGEFTITLNAAQTASSLTVEEGIVNFAGTQSVSLGAGVINVNAGATLSQDTNARIATTAGSILNLSGTLRTTNTGAAGTFFDTDTQIVLGSGGGTFDYPVVNTLNIVQTGTVISGNGSLTKTGAGVLAFALDNPSWTGATIINDGELRIRTTGNNRLPATTNVTINSPGILNLNSVSLTVASVAGNGTIGTGSGTLTLNQNIDTTLTGPMLNIANAGASGVTTGNGRLVKNGTGTLTFAGVNDIRGSVTLNAGGITVNPGASLCGDIADLIVNGGTLTLNQAAETIENLSGTGGTIVLGPGHTLTSDPIGSTTYAGVISGPGAFTRLNVLSGGTTRTTTLSGANTYDGITTISGGIISVGHPTALGSTVGHTVVASGAEVLFTGAAVNFTVAEPLRIAGAGNTDGGAIAVIASANPTLSGPITLTGDATVTVSSSASATFSNAAAFTSLSNQSLTLAGGNNPSGFKLISGAISLGAGGLTKIQSGTWTLGGANTWTGATNINAGTLLVTGSITGTSAVNVTSTLGGSGTITPASAGNVSLLAGGKLSPGTSAGNLSLVLSGGGQLDLTAGITSNTGGLVFELDTPTASDKITITGGALNIGSGLLNFDDFAFTPLGGFAEGDYTLFDGDTAIVGLLGASLSGPIGLFTGEIQLANGGTDLVLHVIPEPSTAALLLGSLGLLARRRRS